MTEKLLLGHEFTTETGNMESPCMECGQPSTAHKPTESSVPDIAGVGTRVVGHSIPDAPPDTLCTRCRGAVDVVMELAFPWYPGGSLDVSANAIRARCLRDKHAEQDRRLPCCRCGEPVVEFSIPNDVWNRVVRRGGREHDREYLCAMCFGNDVRWALDNAQGEPGCWAPSPEAEHPNKSTADGGRERAPSAQIDTSPAARREVQDRRDDEECGGPAR